MAALDGAAPRVLGRFSARFGTPIAMNLLTGSVATGVMVLAFSITGGNALKYFTVVLGLAISTTTIAYIAIFLAVIKLRYSRPNVPRPYRVPGGRVMVWTVGGLCTFWAIFATIVVIYPGLGMNWFGQQGNPNDALPSGFTRWQFEMSQFIPLMVFLILGILFYAAGAPTRRRTIRVSIAEEMGVSEAGTPPGQAHPAGASGAGHPATMAQPGPANADPTSIPDVGTKA